MAKNIVILGGSYGGASVAHYTLKHVVPSLPEPESYKIVVVSASAQVICRPATPRALIDDALFPQDKLFVDIASQFTQYPTGSFEFVNGTATELDHIGRKVTVGLAAGGAVTIDYYSLVIATGSSSASPMLSINHDTATLRASWEAFRAALPNAKSIVIAGGGPAGIETAGELGEHLNGQAGWFKSKLEYPKVSITVITAGSQILPFLRPALAAKAEGYLAKVGVDVIKNAKVTTVTPLDPSVDGIAAKTSLTLDNGRVFEADLYIPATGTKPNTSFIDKTLLKPDGRVDTNASTLRVDRAGERVYAIGDASSYARPAVHVILEAVPVLCSNLKRDLLLAAGVDAAEDRIFKEDTRETQLVPIGKSKGVGAAMGYQVPSFLVWLIKGRDYWLWTTGGLWSGKQWAKAS